MYCYSFFILNYIAFVLAAWTKIPIKLYMMWIITIFSMIAFLYDPFIQARLAGSAGVDLCRHFDSLDSIRLGFDDGLYIEAPLSALYLRMVAYLFDDNSFLPLISTWIYYGLVFFTCNKFFHLLQLNTSLQRFAICMILMCGVFFGVMNNIRYPLAIAIFFLGLYYDVTKKYIFTVLLYCLAALMHPGSIMLLIVRCISMIRLKFSIVFFPVMTFFIFTYFESIIGVAVSLLSPFPEVQVLLLAISMKSVHYSVDSIYDVPLLYRVLTMYMSCFLIFCYMVHKYYGQYRQEFRNIYRMTIFVTLLSFLGSITNFMEGNFAGRLMSIAPFFIALLVSDTLLCLSRENKNYMYVKILFFLLALPYICVYLFKVYPNWIYLGL